MGWVRVCTRQSPRAKLIVQCVSPRTEEVSSPVTTLPGCSTIFARSPAHADPCPRSRPLLEGCRVCRRRALGAKRDVRSGRRVVLICRRSQSRRMIASLLGSPPRAAPLGHRRTWCGGTVVLRGWPRSSAWLPLGRATAGTGWHRRIRRASSTTRTAGFGDSPRASPPTAPGARARSCPGNSRYSPTPRRHGC